jgi:hypothetical protein
MDHAVHLKPGPALNEQALLGIFSLQRAGYRQQLAYATQQDLRDSNGSACAWGPRCCDTRP